MQNYQQGERFFDEMFTPDGAVRPHYQGVQAYLERLGVPEFERRRSLLDLAFRNQGITFTVYGDSAGTERTFPFDPVPRIIPASEWATLEAGLTQRVKALNAFLRDIYSDAQILKEGIIPSELVYSSSHFRREVHGLKVPLGVYTHIVGSDLIRDEQGNYLVLEDNLRSPSGVSYLLANRAAMTRIYPGMFDSQGVRTVQHYPNELLRVLSSLSPRAPEATVVLLTPGMYNSAYFEHAYLAQQMGVELVEGRDLFVDNGRVWMRTTNGRTQVDVIYRRVDDEFLDPLTFRRDSALGVPGLVEVYRQGRVAIANAIGAGVADDKAVYAYVPQMIEYYLGEKAILGNVPTYLGWDKDQLGYILENASELVIKAVGEAGGYGMLIGPASTQQEVADFLVQVRENPRNYIGQPVVGLSRHPTFYTDSGDFEAAHVDLRPYILVGKDVSIIPGGLTRVALKRGSLVVNSSQGGGSKDTWVLDHDGPVNAQIQSQFQGAPLQGGLVSPGQPHWPLGGASGPAQRHLQNAPLDEAAAGQSQSQSQSQSGGGTQSQSQAQQGEHEPPLGALTLNSAELPAEDTHQQHRFLPGTELPEQLAEQSGHVGVAHSDQVPDPATVPGIEQPDQQGDV
ncbi:circularly permuted type 2 ATP-grasp protein [Deinococcus detaillensis]|uniref:Circularly permuted type 2 ATP-grasp protein n=1 Tax=Deinococcus detaillensis TaxID=2592048 RepID=A0A553UR52_9DEIO|nr:circularly permuted type 2 ATP-grasp protein [Deinococcus detaillensis]TSA82441.1 circularly permuted type 2 ATP-grasp protein [Deinococcus detaillensis]